MRATNATEGWQVHHYGDYSGDVILSHPRISLHLSRSRDARVLDTVEIPYAVLEAIVLDKLRDDKVRRLEDAANSAVLLEELGLR